MAVEIIDVDQGNVSAQESSIRGAGVYFKGSPLVPCDQRTTIAANSNGKISHATSQMLVESLGEAMDIEASNIKALGDEFEAFDQMLTNLWEQGPKYPTISQG